MKRHFRSTTGKCPTARGVNRVDWGRDGSCGVGWVPGYGAEVAEKEFRVQGTASLLHDALDV